MKFRKLITLATMCLSLAGVTACSTSNSKKTESELNQESTSLEEQTGKENESTEKATEKETEKSTEKPTETPTEKATEKPTEKATEAPAEKPTEAPTEEATENTILNPKEYFKRGAEYLFYNKLSDTQIEVDRLYFSESSEDCGGVNSSMKGYLIENGNEDESDNDFITYDGKKYYYVVFQPFFQDSSYTLTDKTIEIAIDESWGGGSITFKMLTQDSIVIESVDGIGNKCFKVGNTFVLSE